MHSSDPLLTASSTTPASSSNAAAHTSPRQSTTARLASSPRDRTSALPSISDLVHSTRPSLQTRVDSSSSVSSLGSVRSPPPPYEPSSSATVGSRSPPSLGSLPPLPPITGLNNLGTSTVRRAGPRSTAAPAGPSLSTDAPRPASTTITNSIATQTTPQVNASTSFSSSSPSSFANLYPLFPGTSRHTDIPHAPILSNVTSPSPQASTLLYNPAQSPIWPAPPLPPVPPELQSERTARRSREPNDGLHRSLSADIPHQSASMGHLPVRSNSEPLSSTSSLLRTGDNFTERRNSNSLSSHYRPLRRQVMQSLREAARNLSTSSPLAGNREGSAPNLMISGSPSGRSETSFMSGTTIPLESQTLTSAPASRPESSTATGYAIGQHSTSPSGSCIPLERPRRPYVVTATNPTIIHSPGTEALRTRLDPRPPQTPYHGDLLRESNQPKGMEGKQTGLTPDIEELSNFSSSPTSPRVGARTAEECEARPSRPTVGLSGRGGSRNRFEEGTFGEVESPKECHIPDISAAIRESLPNPRRPVRTDSSPFSSSPARASVQAVSEAERYASDLASQLNTSTTRSQALLNEMYKVKLQKAKEKIDRLQGKLMELGKRDFVIERQLEKERMELKDWEIAKLDSSIMRDLGKLTEAEYARLKRGKSLNGASLIEWLLTDITFLFCRQSSTGI